MTASLRTTDAAREALRREHNVRVVTPDQEGFAADKLPDGVYGFTASPALASPLFAVRHYRNFEIHRLTNGVIAVIGFVTPDVAHHLAEPPRTEPITVMVHPDAEGDADAIVAIPYDRVVQHRQYSVRNAEAIALMIAPAGSVDV